jgi:hypothetical protein
LIVESHASACGSTVSEKCRCIRVLQAIGLRDYASRLDDTERLEVFRRLARISILPAMAATRLFVRGVPAVLLGAAGATESQPGKRSQGA